MRDLTHLYKVIKGVRVSEKSAREAEKNTFVFNVDLSSDKRKISDAVELFFNVKVKSVRTAKIKGKTKSFRGVFGKRNDVKKAYVTLADGYSIDAFGAE